MNLLTEYYRRHGVNYLLPTNESYVFFEDCHETPMLVCLMSTHPRNYNTCYRCQHGSSGIIVEVFSPNRETPLLLTSHIHIKPDDDLLTKVINNFDCSFSPFYAKNYRDIEVWLWRFFISHNRYKSSRSWIAISESIKSKDEYLIATEQMASCALKNPKVYHSYYTMYQSVVSGRNYLLYE